MVYASELPTSEEKTKDKDESFLGKLKQLKEFVAPTWCLESAVNDIAIAINKGELEYVCSDKMWHHWMQLYRGLDGLIEDRVSTNNYRIALESKNKDV